MRLQELTTSLTRSQLGVWAGDTMVRFRGSSRSCFTAYGTGFQVPRVNELHPQVHTLPRGLRPQDMDRRGQDVDWGPCSPAAEPSPR